MHSFVLHNDQIAEAPTKLLSPGQVGLLSGWGVFSTIRVAEGVLFAWERHWARMKHDAELLRVPFPDDPEQVRRSLLKLLRGEPGSVGDPARGGGPEPGRHLGRAGPGPRL